MSDQANNFNDPTGKELGAIYDAFCEGHAAPHFEWCPYDPSSTLASAWHMGRGTSRTIVEAKRQVASLQESYATQEQMLDAAHKRIAELEQPELQLRYQTFTEYEGMLQTAEKRIAELEAVIDKLEHLCIAYMSEMTRGTDEQLLVRIRAWVNGHASPT